MIRPDLIVIGAMKCATSTVCAYLEDHPDVFMVRAVSLQLPMDQTWSEAGAQFMRAELGTDFGYKL